MNIRRRFVVMSNKDERDAYHARGHARKSRIRIVELIILLQYIDI